jgi:CBS domain-containing protein
MRTGVALLSSDVDVATAKQQFEKEKVHSWPIGDHNYLQGVVRSHDIETAQPSPAAMRDLIKAHPDYPYVHSDHPLSYALERMGTAGVDVVPVVSRANIHQMYGIVTLASILATYGVPATASEVK